MEDKKQGSALGEMMNLSKEFVDSAEKIFKIIQRKLIKSDGNLDDDLMLDVTGFGLSCVMITGKVNDWMKDIAREGEGFIKKEESGESRH